MLEAHADTITRLGVDLEYPSVVRVYDYLLGGSANWAIDRAFGDLVVKQFPEMRNIARANRMFLSRAVRHLASRGVRQFLDIGSGVLSWGNTHQVADAINPDSRVVYVDNEPVVVAHAEVLLDEDGDLNRHAVICADLQYPDELWNDVLTTGIIRSDEPVAVLMSHVLQVFQPKSDGTDIAARSVARYRELLPVGSYLSISHVTNERIPRELLPKLANIKYLCETHCRFEMFCRSRKAIEALLGEFEILPPGMAWAPEWRPDPAASDPFVTPNHAVVWAGVGRKVR